MGRSILDDLGEEVTGIVSAVFSAYHFAKLTGLVETTSYITKVWKGEGVW